MPGILGSPVRRADRGERSCSEGRLSNAFDRRVLLIAAGVTLAQVAYVALMPLERVTLYVNDDAYYYLLVARNWLARGFPTFDGTSLTNGFQVLWQLLILPFGLAGSKALQLRLSLGLGAVLMQVGIVGFAASLGILGGARLRVVFLAAAEAQGMLIWAFALNGMESSVQAALLGLIALALALESVEALARPELVLGSLAGLYGLSRLDGLALVPFLGAYLWLRGRRSRDGWLGLALALGPAAAVMLVNAAATGSPLPVSSEVKLLPAESFGLHWLARAEAGMVSAAKLAYYLATRAVGGYIYFTARLLSIPYRVVSYSSAAVLAVVLVLVARRAGRREIARLAPLLPIVALVCSRVAFFVWAYPTTFHLFDWYWTDGLFVLLILLAVFAAPFRHPRVAVWLGGFLVVVNFGAFLANSENRAHLQPVEEAVAYVGSLDLPPSEPVASWDAGYVAFLFPRPVINLDGLVNSREYYESVLVGGEELSRYLQAHDVRYVVNLVYRGTADPSRGFRGLRAGEFAVAFTSRTYRAPFGEPRQCVVLKLVGQPQQGRPE